MALRFTVFVMVFGQIAAHYSAVTSASTPPALAAFFPSSLSLAEAGALLETDLLIDATFEELSAAALAALSRELQVPLLVLGPAVQLHDSDWTYYLGGKFETIAVSLDTVLRCLGVHSANLIGDSSAYSLHLGQALRSLNSTVLYEPLLVLDSVEAYVGKVMRPKGNRMTVFTTRPGVTKQVLKAQFNMHIGGAGYANLLPFYSALYTLDLWDTEDNLRDGNLVVAEQDEASLSTEEQAAAQLFTLISPYLQSLDSKALLDAVFPTHNRFQGQHPVLLNMRNSTKLLVGQVLPSTCVFTAPLHYLGNSTAFSQTAAAIPVSGSFAETDPVFGFLGTYAVTVAAVLGFDEINSSPSFLPNFKIEVWNFSAGVFVPDMTALTNVVLPHKDKLGAAILANIGSASTMPLITFLRQHNVTTPVVGAITSESSLTSQTDFPNFIRLCLSDDSLNTVIVQTIKNLGWSKCALLVVDTPKGLLTRTLFQQLLSNSGIEIVNDPSYQVIASNVSTLEEARANFTAAFQHIIDTRCRVVVAVTIVTWDLVPLVFYELGMRKGDLVVVGRGWIAPLSFEALDEVQTAHTAEVMYGSIQLSPQFFVGSVGNSFQHNFYERTHFPPLSYSCLYYYAAYAVGYALKWLLQTGQDFLNSAHMIKALRSARFVGCTGLVSFETQTNDRQSMRYTLDTLLYNSSGLYLQHIGVYDPAGMVLLSIDSTFVWGDGTTKLPRNMREALLGCPFEDRLNQPFEEGSHVVLGVCCAYCVYAAVVGFLAWRRFQRPLQHLSERREIRSDDVLVMLGVYTDFVQSVALSCSLYFVSPQLQHILSASIGDFAQYEDLKVSGFAHLWIAVECMNCGFLVGVGLLQSACCKHAYGLTHTLLDLWVYVFAHWLFVPNAVILLSVFDCSVGVANIGEAVTFESSYLAADCYLTCWTAWHLVMVAFTVFTLLSYLAVAVVYRPGWQSSRTHLNIHADAFFLCSSPAFQMLQVVLFLGIQEYHPMVQASISLGIWTLRLVYCVVKSTYGYSRLRIRYRVTIAAVLWAVLVCLCWQAIAQYALLFTVLLWVGWALICLGGEVYILLRVPGLLYRPVGVDTVPLFKFAFKPASKIIIFNLQREFQMSQSRCSMRLDSWVPNRSSEGRELGLT